MTTATLPVPLRFELPNPDWTPADPTSLGVGNAAFLAVRRNLSDEYAPVITISGARRDDPATMDDIAEEWVDKLRREGDEVELVTRRDLGTDEAPAVVQVTGLTAVTDGRRHDLRQTQAIMGYVDADDPGKRVVVVHTLTCTFGQFDQMTQEFRQYLASIELVTQPAEDA